jgi:uncharacterized SAM-binding protein YcdF (DUF218 family)
MSKMTRTVLAMILAGGIAFSAGFAVFLRTIATPAAPSPTRVDAIVVLTGGEDRIAAGLKLLRAGTGQRLLISGVNARTVTPAELSKRHEDNDRLLKCCIDLGREAHDTIGNAIETREWVEMHGFQRLIVVTSSYHLPRTLNEFARAMPGVTLIGHPVGSRHYRLDSWWNHYPTARLLGGEFVKFLASSLSLGVSRLTGNTSWPSPAAQHRPLAAGTNL